MQISKELPSADTWGFVF